MTGEFDVVIAGGPDGHDWGYTGATGLAGRSIRALRGKALGGSSAVNAAVAIRARAADFAKWTRRGTDGWTFDDVLPAFKAIDEWLDFVERRSAEDFAASRAKGPNLPGIAVFFAAIEELVSDEQGTLAEQEEGDR